MSNILIYSDGSCFPNPGPRGGWGVVLIDKSGQLHTYHGRYKGETNTTNNRMEITAVLMGLRCALLHDHTDSKIIIRSDSLITIKCSRGEYERRNNHDLWRQIDAEIKKFLQYQLQFEWVRGHDGDTFNTMADRLASGRVR